MILNDVSRRTSEHDLFAYSALPTRPAIKWKGGADLALSIFLYFETMDFGVPNEAVRDPRWKDRFQPDPRLYSWYEYGNRVAIFRILDVLDHLGLSVTIAANALACERYPYLVEEFLKRNYEIAAHGHAANVMISSALHEMDEHATIADSIERIHRITGKRPKGWIGQDFGQSTSTPNILRELGMLYVSDWPNDDQPFLMTGAGNLVSLPAPVDWDDMRLFWDRRLQAWIYPDIISAVLKQLAKDAQSQSRFFSISIHPWVLGAPHRIRYLEKALETIAMQDRGWNATALEIAEQFLNMICANDLQ